MSKSIWDDLAEGFDDLPMWFLNLLVVGSVVMFVLMVWSLAT